MTIRVNAVQCRAWWLRPSHFARVANMARKFRAESSTMKKKKAMRARGEAVLSELSHARHGRLWIQLGGSPAHPVFTYGRESYTAAFGSWTEHGWDAEPAAYTGMRAARRTARLAALGKQETTSWH